MSKFGVVLLACLTFVLGFGGAVLLRQAGPLQTSVVLTPADPSPPGPTVAGPELGLTLKNYPVIDGSTSTRPLGQLLFFRSVGMPVELRKIPS